MVTIRSGDAAMVLTGDGNDKVMIGAGRFGYVATADAGNNKLVGRAGSDELNGLGGRDTLIGGTGKDVIDGGKGNDLLRGNAGADDFVFGRKSGTDTVKDYQDGIDTLRIEGHMGGFAAHTITRNSGDKVIVHDGGTIVLDDKAGVTLTASDFDFVRADRRALGFSWSGAGDRLRRCRCPGTECTCLIRRPAAAWAVASRRRSGGARPIERQQDEQEKSR